jgi:hypothetical protein
MKLDETRCADTRYPNRTARYHADMVRLHPCTGHSCGTDYSTVGNRYREMKTAVLK